MSKLNELEARIAAVEKRLGIADRAAAKKAAAEREKPKGGQVKP